MVDKAWSIDYWNRDQDATHLLGVYSGDDTAHYLYTVHLVAMHRRLHVQHGSFFRAHQQMHSSLRECSIGVAAIFNETGTACTRSCCVYGANLPCPLVPG